MRDLVAAVLSLHNAHPALGRAPEAAAGAGAAEARS
jgi:hypothetical protein